MIEVRNLTKTYGAGEARIQVLRGLDLDIAQGEFVALLGSSGSGKSTLMNILGCLDSPTSGQYHLGGRDVSRLGDRELAEVRNRKIGFVFQSFHLLPRATALENVMLPLGYRGMRTTLARQRAAEALARVGLSHRLTHRPTELSGGQRQRVAIARALVGEPTVLLADEPTGNLDSETSAEVMQLFAALHREGHTIVLVTHDEAVAAVCRRRILMKDGKIATDATADVAA